MKPSWIYPLLCLVAVATAHGDHDDDHNEAEEDEVDVLLQPVEEGAEPRGIWCSDACGNSLAKVPFTDTEHDVSRQRQWCTGRLHLESMYLCLGLRCDPDVRDNALRDLNQTCQDGPGVTLPPYEIVAHFTDEEIARLPRVNSTAVGRDPAYDVPVLPSASLFTAWFKTAVRLPWLNSVALKPEC